MKKKLLTSLVFLHCSLVFAQAPDTLWTKTFGGGNIDEGRFVQQTSDDGYILVGYTDSFSAGFSDVWLIKTNSLGDTLWTKTLGGSGYDMGSSVLQTNDSGYILVGYTDLFGNGFPDVWLIKTNSSGDTLWTKTFGGIYWDEGFSIQQTTDDGYIITGFTYSFGAGNDDLWLIRTNSSGDTLWTKTFGGWSSDGGHSVYQTTEAGYIITGYTNSFGAGMADVWLIKTNNLGDTLWTKTFGGSYDDKGYSVMQTNDSGYILVGYAESFGGRNIWLLKTDTSGDTLWTKIIGGAGSDVGYSVQQTTDSGYIITGSTSENLWLIKTNSSGDTLWTKTFGESGYYDTGYSVQQTTDGGYITIGSTNLSTAGGGDVWLIKTSTDVSVIEPSSALIISDYYLQQNFPNPFNPSTKISWQVPVSSWQTLKIYDVLGNEIATLVDEYKPAGKYEVEFNSHSGNVRNLSSGIYFYQLLVSDLQSKDGKAENYIKTKKMILLK